MQSPSTKALAHHNKVYQQYKQEIIMVKKSMFSGSSKTAEEIKAKQQAKQAVATPKAASIQAMVWYKEEDWETLLGLFVDTELLPKSYSDWSERAEAKKAEVEAAGHQVIKVFIDPVTFPEWCKEKNMEMNSEARAQLAIEVAQAQSFSL